jgi:hypothetical protein
VLLAVSRVSAQMGEDIAPAPGAATERAATAPAPSQDESSIANALRLRAHEGQRKMEEVHTDGSCKLRVVNNPGLGRAERQELPIVKRAGALGTTTAERRRLPGAPTRQLLPASRGLRGGKTRGLRNGFGDCVAGAGERSRGAFNNAGCRECTAFTALDSGAGRTTGWAFCVGPWTSGLWCCACVLCKLEASVVTVHVE